MKKIFLILFISSLFSLTAQDAFDTVVAQVKLTKTTLIKQSELEKGFAVAKIQLGRELTDKDKETVLDSLINNEVLKQAVKRDGINVTEDMILNVLRQQVSADATDEDIKKAVALQYNSTWEEVSKALIDQLSIQEYIKVAGAEDLKTYNIAPTQEEINAFYNKNKTKFVNPDLVRGNHLLFSTVGKSDEESAAIKKKAEETLLKIKQGTVSFDQLMEEAANDKDGTTNGGDLGYIYLDDAYLSKVLGNDFINKVMELPMESVSGVLKSNSGYHIVVLTEKRSARILKLSDPINPVATSTVQQYIQKSLMQENQTKAITQVAKLVIDRVRSEATIKIIEQSLPWK